MEGREVTLSKNKLACSALVDDDVIEVIATEQIHVIVVFAPPALVDAPLQRGPTFSVCP